jgi:hypothetical protein
MDFNAIITGDREAVAHLEGLPKEIRGSLRARIQKLTDQLLSRVQALAPEKTGDLKNEIVSKVTDSPGRIKGVVTLASGLSQSEYRKAAALEYGSHKNIAVRAHSRTISQAFGRTISPVAADIRAYDRVANVDARIYLRGGLAEMEAEVVTELTEAINELKG